MMDSVGKMVKIEGRVSGSQPLKVTWYKDNNEIYGSDKYDVSFKDNMAMLCVRDSATSDSGVYTCEASNEAGKASCRVSLTISGMNSLFDIFIIKMRFMFMSCLSPKSPRTQSNWSLGLTWSPWFSCSILNKYVSLYLENLKNILKFVSKPSGAENSLL